ncbi:sarcoplasmic calcium-binding protein isoform X2 [Lingula anatina]|uniref:Sarcoplasmic calcium-binding protein isoform X2 n=1 Tax=Lingula anatina TaxID=7574 RepID=A0A1S3JVC1_LINAN|nr:sarcoplasmic calcium-binding protein isoform X2 [Lingula anatina]|eukprot:XP_013414237.1 sarcoplasmic calcium-binding protein isoform X2 [Lingula anatina]
MEQTDLLKLVHSYPEVKGSEIWLKKMRTLFERCDADGNKYLSKEDFIQMAQRDAEYNNLKEGDPKAKEVLEARLSAWRNAVLRGQGNPDTDRVTKEDFVQNILCAVNTPWREQYPVLTRALFNAVDMNSDGIISQREHAGFFFAYRIPLDLSPAAFDAIDTNKDGKISLEEFSRAFIDFFLGEDPSSPHNTFYGPLLE